MPDLAEFIRDIRKDNPGANIAGYVVDKKFHYEVSRSEHLPAAAFFLDSTPRLETNVYSTLPMKHWIYTYQTAKNAKGGIVAVSGMIDSKIEVTGVVKAGKRQIRVLAGEGAEGPLSKAGGLLEAAKTLTPYKAKDNVKLPKVHTADKGLHRALRYYMLAAYAVLGKCAKTNYEGGNYVCALGVNDSGQIFSWGVNSGSFHHGEVNMLMNYFASNPTAKSLPSDSIVFSTLTPCQQCSGFLQTVSPGRIFMGQKDTGPLGQAGEAHGVYLGKLTDPVTARVTPGEGQRQRVTETIHDPNKVSRRNKTGAVELTRFVVNPVPDGTHFDVDNVLGQLVTDGNIASKIGEYCKRELSESYDMLARKFEKTRKEDLLDQKTKTAVLTYLQQWIKTVGTEPKMKDIA